MSQRIALAFAATVSLAGCGPSLGKYEVIDMDLVEDLPEIYYFYRKSGPQLQVLLRSDFDLATVGDTYSYKIECGWNGDSEISIAGPMVAGAPPLEIYDVRDKMPRRAAGRMEYLLFLPVGVVMDPSSDGDLCLKIIQAGYYITESRSETIRIPAEDIARTLNR